MNKVFALLLSSLLLTACHESQALNSWSSIKYKTLSDNNPKKAYLGTYQGTLPCADCKGVAMELKLEETGRSKKFILKQEYMGKAPGKNTSVTTGIWFMANGNKQNPNAKVLQLIPDGKDELLYFELMKDGSLKLLDRRQNTLKSKLNYTLKKQRT